MLTELINYEIKKGLKQFFSIIKVMKNMCVCWQFSHDWIIYSVLLAAASGSNSRFLRTVTFNGRLIDFLRKVRWFSIFSLHLNHHFTFFLSFKTDNLSIFFFPTKKDEKKFDCLLIIIIAVIKKCVWILMCGWNVFFFS